MPASMTTWLALAVVAAIPTAAQTPAFEVATVKPGDPNARVSGGSCHGTDSNYGGFVPVTPPALGRCLFLQMTLRGLIQEAYDLRGPNAEDMVVGGPSWIASRKFTVEAKAEQPTTVAEMRLMLRSLLLDRFQLRLHSETRELAGFEMVLASPSGGPKPGTSGEKPNLASQGRGRLIGTNAPLSQLVTVLRMTLSKPVVDRTGLTGGYDFSLTWTPDENEGGLSAIVARLPADVRSRIGAADPNGPSLFTALQEQLGLRLVAQKVPAEVLAIEAAELPADN